MSCDSPNATHHMACACREKMLAQQIRHLEDERDAAWKAASEHHAAWLESLDAPTLQLHAGEMSAQELRTSLAILKWLAANIRESCHINSHDG